ncbi:GT34-family glycosyltransferase [Chara braunii]|uniref:GT34-family glycosyltransferase n=1 Tax=Chara braunii TaxID=69332 RepID=A0A388LJV7_CHABU|nr:GT34-family glycosyltransferase [Chara braunii]|eukprot:GBG82533.1 GT34-family glycosyltransferase [Chara braunii]
MRMRLQLLYAVMAVATVFVVFELCLSITNTWTPSGGELSDDFLCENNPDVMIVTSSQPHCADADGNLILLRSLKNKVDYARLHGFQVLYPMENVDMNLTGNWNKIAVLRGAMRVHKAVKWFFWLDSDALITDMLFEIPWKRYNGLDLVVVGSPNKIGHYLGFNAGILLIRNSEWSWKLLDTLVRVQQQFKTNVTFQRAVRRMVANSPPWLGDQTAFAYLLAKSKKWRARTGFEEGYTLNGFWKSTEWADPGKVRPKDTFPRDGLTPPFVTHFAGCSFCSGQQSDVLAECKEKFARAFFTASNQVLAMYGVQHKGLTDTMESVEIE